MDRVDQLLRGISVSVPAGQKLYGVMPGDSVRVKATIDYRGPRWDDYFYAAIGIDGIFGFDEIWRKQVDTHFDASTDWVTYELTVEIPIIKIAILPWTPGWFDIYAKLTRPGLTGLFTPTLDNVIEVLLAAEFDHFTIDSYDIV
ncbi:hypothetical protein ES708_00024 [subsurface metagenome]